MSGTIRLIGGVVTYLCTHDSQLQSCELESTNEQLKLAHARRSLTVGRTRCSDGMNTKKYHFAKEWYYNLRSYEWSYKQLKKKKKKKLFCGEWLAVISQPRRLLVRRLPGPSWSIHLYAWTTCPGTLGPCGIMTTVNPGIPRLRLRLRHHAEFSWNTTNALVIESDHIFVLSDQNGDWAGNMFFQEILLFAALQLWLGHFSRKYSLKKNYLFPLDDWVVKDRGGECFSTLAKQFAIFSPNILHRRLLSPGNNTGQHAENTI